MYVVGDSSIQWAELTTETPFGLGVVCVGRERLQASVSVGERESSRVLDH